MLIKLLTYDKKCQVILHWSAKKKLFFRLPIKIQGGSYSFVIAESEYDNQITQSPTNVKGKGIN
jgi:hypothetical protein